MKSAGKARSNGLYRHIRTSKEIIRNLLNDSNNNHHSCSFSILYYYLQKNSTYAVFFLRNQAESTPFLRKPKNDTKYRWMATRQKPYRYLMSLFLFTFHRKKACPKSSAAPFRQNRPLSFRNHRSEAPADSGYILLKSDRIFNQSRSGIFPSICAPSLFLFPVFSLFLTLLNSTAEKI